MLADATVSVRNSCPSVRPRRVTFQSGKQLSRVPCPADRQLFGQFAFQDRSGQATFKQGNNFVYLLALLANNFLTRVSNTATV
jgi:hypothetical protein